MGLRTFATHRGDLSVALGLWILGMVVFRLDTARAGETILFEQLSTDQGMSQVSVQNMLQDRQGFIWFGTQDGLNKFDGYQFVIYRHDEQDTASLGDNDVWTMVEDDSGALWIGLYNGGLNRFDPRTETFTRYNHRQDNPNSLSEDRVRALYLDSSGTLWIGSEGGGLSQFDPHTRSFEHYRHQPKNANSLGHDTVEAIYPDSPSALWIGTCGGGLNHFDRRTGTFTHYRHRADDPTSLSHDCVKTLLKDSTGSVWVGTVTGGLNRLDPQTGRFTRFQRRPDDPTSLSNNSVRAIFEDAKGRLWIGTRGGVDRFDRKTQSFTNFSHQEDNPDSLSHDYVYSILEDRSGGMWFGTLGGGVNRFDPLTHGIKTYRRQRDNPNSLAHNIIRAVHVDSVDNVWVSTYLGVDKFDPRTETFTHYKLQTDRGGRLVRDYIFSITETPSAASAGRSVAPGDLWFGSTESGLKKLDPASGTFTAYHHRPEDPNSISDDNVEVVYTDIRGDLWVGTVDTGLNRFDRKTQTFERFRHDPENPASISSDEIRAICQQRDGTMWVGTNMGLDRMNLVDKKFEHFRHDPSNPSSLSHDMINKLVEDSKGNLWVGTDGGLSRFDPIGETFTTYRERDGLPNLMITCVQEDQQGLLWVGTNEGLVKFDPQKKSFASYDKLDGLQGNSFMRQSCGIDSSGRLFFGGEGGLSVFRPTDVRENTLVPPTVITDFLLFNKSVEIARDDAPTEHFRLPLHINHIQEIALDYTDYIFTFEFSALNYRQPVKNQFAYRLEGFDRQWIETDYRNRRATYTDIPHGSYTLRVKASNDDGHWNEQGAAVRLTILPPPWRTWWAYSLYTIVALALLIWFVQVQRNKVKQKQRELDRERQVSARLRQLDKLKDEFLANTSHELRTPLNGIIGIAESLIEAVEKWPAEKTKANLAMIYSSGKRLASLVDDILDFSKMRNQALMLNQVPVDLRALIEVVLANSSTFIKNKSVELKNSVQADLPPAHADENRLQQILYNLIGNAIKFTEAGTIALSASAADGQLRISVTDTGIGIPEDKIETIFESFEQVEGSAARVYGGTGLGLAVTKKLVELHGGGIEVSSRVDRGSTFTFTLPISEEEPAGDEASARTAPVIEEEVEFREAKFTSIAPTVQAPIDPPSDPTQGEFHILIVDDDPINLQVLENHLSLQHYRITQAANGVEALDYIEGGDKFDLILLDIMMPKMSGYEVAERLRTLYATHELPVIFLTAKNQVSDLVAGFAAGGNDYLTKPIAKPELLSRVKTHLDLLDTNRNLEQKVRERTVELRDSLEKLKKTQKQLAAASRRAGMTTVANGVLHNVGNVLNSVNTSTHLIRDRYSQVDYSKLDDLVKLFADHEDDLPGFFAVGAKGRKIPDYLKTLGRHWADQREEVMSEMLRLRENVDRIERVVAAQRKYAGAAGVLETAALQSLVETAVEMSDLSGIADEIEIVRSFDELPEMMAETHKIVQIMVHLLNNAAWTLRMSRAEQKRLTLELKQSTDDIVRMGIIDNGIGIPKENLTTIFQHGFTTIEGRDGIGLHNAANTAVEIGGKLSCHSDGEDRGASFYLEIPTAPQTDTGWREASTRVHS